MRKMILIAVMMCACCSFGQSRLPQWKVITAKHIVGGTQPMKNVTIFTPSKNGIYRLSAYMSAVGQAGGWSSLFIWKDAVGTDASATVGASLQQGYQSFQQTTVVFSPIGGTPMLLNIEEGNVGSTYDLVYTIEKLTH